MRTLVLLLGIAHVYAHYSTQPSGYGNNNAYEVQHTAKKSPNNKPVDYTRSNDFPGFNFIGNKVSQQNLGQHNQQGQTNVQKGGDQTNVGANANAVNVGQVNNQDYSAILIPNNNFDGRYQSHDAPTYTAILIPRSSYGQSQHPLYDGEVIASSPDNKMAQHQLGQGANQGRYTGGAQAGTIVINNIIYVTQTATQTVSGTR
ncbi:hypothetical protein RB195_002932 [Necator americanus]|uniref:Uncharacterized protein n=1 Tax=Necator americanus TaxID=51031 RepID=A0ABR1DM68_NECAM